MFQLFHVECGEKGQNFNYNPILFHKHLVYAYFLSIDGNVRCLQNFSLNKLLPNSHFLCDDHLFLNCRSFSKNGNRHFVVFLHSNVNFLRYFV
jgi:hypothetical protein